MKNVHVSNDKIYTCIFLIIVVHYCCRILQRGAEVVRQNLKNDFNDFNFQKACYVEQMDPIIITNVYKEFVI